MTAVYWKACSRGILFIPSPADEKFPATSALGDDRILELSGSSCCCVRRSKSLWRHMEQRQQAGPQAGEECLARTPFTFALCCTLGTLYLRSSTSRRCRTCRLPSTLSPPTCQAKRPIHSCQPLATASMWVSACTIRRAPQNNYATFLTRLLTQEPSLNARVPVHCSEPLRRPVSCLH